MQGYKNFQGGDATENRDFQREKQRLQGSNCFSDLILSTQRIFRGGDATENRDFQREKQRLQGSKIFSDLPMRQKMAIFKDGNSVCRGTKNFQRRK